MMRVLSFIALFFIRFYKVFFSLHLGGTCRFYPSCSSYAEQAFTELPPKKAFVLMLQRLSKCHSFGPCGPDPVNKTLINETKRNKP